MFPQMLGAVVWASMVLAAFVRFQPATTLVVIVCLAIAQLSQVITVFLPLKIIILAGSEGVPRYLSPFLEPDQRDYAIVVLLVATVVFLALTYILRAMAHYLSDLGGMRALSRANEMALPSRERAAAPRFYSQFGELAANLAFVCAASLLLTWLMPALGAVQLALGGIELLLTAMLIEPRPGLRSRGLTRWLSENRSSYLEVLANVNLVVGFLVLLVPLLFGGTQQFLIVILSFLLLKRTLSSLKKAINLLVKLRGQQAEIDPLVFRRKKVLPTLPTEHVRQFRELFSKTNRKLVLQALLPEQDRVAEDLSIRWVDPNPPGVYRFQISCAQDNEDSVGLHYQQLVFTEQSIRLLEHEELLFSHMDRGCLHAPVVVARADEQRFTVQVCNAGMGQHPPKDVWLKQHPMLIAALWCAEPPRALMKAYLSARTMLYGRISDSLIEQAEVAVDNAKEEKLLQALRGVLPELLQRIEGVPGVIHNPALTPGNCMLTREGEVVVMTWWSWMIEPIGFGIRPGAEGPAYEALMARMSRCGRVGRNMPRIEDLQLVGYCQQLERALRREAYKQALVLGERILKNHQGEVQ